MYIIAAMNRCSAKMHRGGDQLWINLADLIEPNNLLSEHGFFYLQRHKLSTGIQRQLILLFRSPQLAFIFIFIPNKAKYITELTVQALGFGYSIHKLTKQFDVIELFDRSNVIPWFQEDVSY
jgi:hypothetical protein